ncbi:mitotubule-associated protein Gb4, putative [Bodo saltans]|uniref:Mitotubule-associated protein Gb4, putative n=1 Tax=Bodo saltans TaxID=75058 RepID=A0A0S4J1F9_BODSA|nr:mitotubule-associated protein Gb4, putative [Bodo saltans]|eukprot:CUG08192.1 mitotubule-associated protein Gb4, putative [Bodo saltans]
MPSSRFSAAGVVAAIFVMLSMELAPFTSATLTNSTNSTNTTNSTSNTTLPFFSMRISGSSWQAALASNRSEVSDAVRLTLSDALDVPEEKVIVVSLTVGSLVAIFLVESDTLTASQVVRSVTVASLAGLQAVYQAAANTNETITLLSITAESQNVSGGGCDDTCIAVSVVASVVGACLVALLVWWLFKFVCAGGEKKLNPNSSLAGGEVTRTAEAHHPVGQDGVIHPIQQWQEQQLDTHEQPLPVHAMDYPRERDAYGGGGGAREMQHYDPRTTYTISPQNTRLSGFRLERAASASPQQQHQHPADYYEEYQTPTRY